MMSFPGYKKEEQDGDYLYIKYMIHGVPKEDQPSWWHTYHAIRNMKEVKR